MFVFQGRVRQRLKQTASVNKGKLYDPLRAGLQMQRSFPLCSVLSLHFKVALSLLPFEPGHETLRLLSTSARLVFCRLLMLLRVQMEPNTERASALSVGVQTSVPCFEFTLSMLPGLRGFDTESSRHRATSTISCKWSKTMINS